VTRGRKAVEGKPNYGHRMLNVNDTAVWDWAIKTARARGLSVSKFVEQLMREQIEREKQANTWE